MPLRSFTQWGPRPTEVGKIITTTIPQLTSPVHHVGTTGTITTLLPPLAILRDVLQVVLIADSAFSWDDSGNIAAAAGTTTCEGAAYEFIYDRNTEKWYPVIGNDCLYRPQ